MSKLKVTGLELKTDKGKKVSLTMQEAEELYNQLNDLFGHRITYLPSYPVVIQPEIYPWRYPPVITYDTSTGAKFKMNSDSGLQVTYSTDTVT